MSPRHLERYVWHEVVVAVCLGYGHHAWPSEGRQGIGEPEYLQSCMQCGSVSLGWWSSKGIVEFEFELQGAKFEKKFNKIANHSSNSRWLFFLNQPINRRHSVLEIYYYFDQIVSTCVIMQRAGYRQIVARVLMAGTGCVRQLGNIAKLIGNLNPQRPLT